MAWGRPQRAAHLHAVPLLRDICIASRGAPVGSHLAVVLRQRFIPETTVGAVLGRVQGRAWFDFAAASPGRSTWAALGEAAVQRVVTGQRDVVRAARVGRVGLGRAGLGPGVPAGGGRQQAQRATIGQMVAYGTAQAPRSRPTSRPGPSTPSLPAATRPRRSTRRAPETPAPQRPLTSRIVATWQVACLCSGTPRPERLEPPGDLARRASAGPRHAGTLPTALCSSTDRSRGQPLVRRAARSVR